MKTNEPASIAFFHLFLPFALLAAGCLGPNNPSTTFRGDQIEKISGPIVLENGPNRKLFASIESENPEFALVIPGSVSVAFYDVLKVRKASQANRVTSIDKEFEREVNGLLARFRATNVVGLNLSQGNIDYDALERQIEIKDGRDIPNVRSIYTFHFPANVDSKSIARTLRAIPGVRRAIASPLAVNTVTTLSIQDNSSLSSPLKPSEQNLNESTFPEEHNWWWFDRFKIFHAMDDYNTSDLPIIAIADSGFKSDASAMDKPNYLSIPGGTSSGTIDGLGQYVSNNFDEPSTNQFSHGSSVASVAGSPANGSYMCGVVPNIPIIAYRLSGGPTHSAVWTACSLALANQARAINFSWAYKEPDPLGLVNDGVEVPIIWSPFTRDAIRYHSEAGLPVVIAAGNSYRNLDSIAVQPTDDGNAIIVGGADKDGKNWREELCDGGFHPNLGSNGCGRCV